MTKAGLLSLCLALEKVEGAGVIQRSPEIASASQPVVPRRPRSLISKPPRVPVQLEILFDDRQVEIDFTEIA